MITNHEPVDNKEQRIKELEGLIALVLERDGCRCDTHVCNWCNDGGWVYVNPSTIKALREAMKCIK